jgi:hypothetical protein
MHRSEAKSADGAKAGTASPEPPAPKTPFQAFEEFARKVVSVPKATIDERERVYQEERRKRKA